MNGSATLTTTKYHFVLVFFFFSFFIYIHFGKTPKSDEDVVWMRMTCRHMPMNCKVVSLLSLPLLSVCSRYCWWWVKHMTKSTEYGAAEHMVVGAMSARLPVVVAAAALPVCGLLMLGISPQVERPCTYKGRLRPYLLLL